MQAARGLELSTYRLLAANTLQPARVASILRSGDVYLFAFILTNGIPSDHPNVFFSLYATA